MKFCECDPETRTVYPGATVIGTPGHCYAMCNTCHNRLMPQSEPLTYYAELIPTPDNVNHPKHYTNSEAKCSQCDHPIECIDITRHQGFAIGNALKYIWRHKEKNGMEDIKKAIWYLQDYIKHNS